MDDLAEIIAAEHAIAAAHVSLDVDALDRLYHPDFTIAQPDGSREIKSQVLASYRSGERHWESAHVEDLHVWVADGTGVALGMWKAAGTNRGISFDYAARFMSVWTRQNGIWLNLAYQALEVSSHRAK